MASFNKVMLMGNLTRDPELSYLPNNTPVVEIGVASNRRFRRQDGEMGEETLFIDCRTFGRTAEVVNQYFRKGSPIFIEGRLQLDRWEDREGNKRSKYRVMIEKFEFLDSRSDSNSGGGGGGGSRNSSGGGGYNESRSSKSDDNYSSDNNGGGYERGGSNYQGEPPMDDDDIPF